MNNAAPETELEELVRRSKWLLRRTWPNGPDRPNNQLHQIDIGAVMIKRDIDLWTVWYLPRGGSYLLYYGSGPGRPFESVAINRWALLAALSTLRQHMILDDLADV